MTIDRALTLIIRGSHGDAVADQFVAFCLDGEPFEDQNVNAMKYIAQTLEEISQLDADEFSAEAREHYEEVSRALEDHQ